MNGIRIHDGEAKPVDRLAAVAKSVDNYVYRTYNRRPDYADYREFMEPYLEREIVLASVNATHAVSLAGVSEFMRSFHLQLLAIDKRIEAVDKKLGI